MSYLSSGNLKAAACWGEANCKAFFHCLLLDYCHLEPEIMSLFHLICVILVHAIASAQKFNSLFISEGEMDPLSVAASVVGLLGAAAKVTTFLYSCWSSIDNAPKLARSLAYEVSTTSGCLAQVQAFLLQPTDSQSLKSRTDLIMVEQVLVSLTDCVCVFSDLEKVIDSLRLDGSMRFLDRAR